MFSGALLGLCVSVVRASMAAPISFKSKAVLGSPEDCLLERSRSCIPCVRLSPLASDGDVMLVVAGVAAGGSGIDMDGVKDRPKVEDFGVDAPELLQPTVKVNAGLGLLSIEAMGSEAGVWLGTKVPWVFGRTLWLPLPSSLPARKANVLGILSDVGVTFPDEDEDGVEVDPVESTCCTISKMRKRGRQWLGLTVRVMITAQVQQLRVERCDCGECEAGNLAEH